MNLKFHHSSVLSFLFISILFFSCGTTSKIIKEPAEDQPLNQSPEPESQHKKHDKDTITLLFAGDIMAHSVNYYITSYEKIWRDVRELISEPNLAFANIEAPIDTTKAAPLIKKEKAAEAVSENDAIKVCDAWKSQSEPLYGEALRRLLGET